MAIMIVDDSPLDRKLLIDLIKKNDFPNEVLEAKDGEEALALLKKRHKEIKLILLDWRMPKVDGLEFLRLTGKSPEYDEIPVVMITSSQSGDTKELAHILRPALAGYLLKPVDLSKLLDTITPHLTRE